MALGVHATRMNGDHRPKLQVSISFPSIRAIVSRPYPRSSMCTPVSIPTTFSCQIGSVTGVCPVTTYRTPSTGPRCSSPVSPISRCRLPVNATLARYLLSRP